MESQFLAWGKRQDFFATFCRNAHVYLLLNFEGKFQIYIEFYGLWLFLNWVSPLFIKIEPY